MSYIIHDGDHASRSRALGTSPGAALALAAICGAVPMVAVIVLLADRDAGAVIAGLGALTLGTGVACRGLFRAPPHDRLGLANLVTLARLMAVCVLFASLTAGSERTWVFAALAAVALSLDGVDGWIARRQNMSSRFGARFDMEVDCALALVLALHAMRVPEFSPWVLLLGVPRYAFGLASLALPWLRRDLPERFSRKMVCVFQISALIALQMPLLPAPTGQALIAAALVALTLSFGRDIVWLWRRRA